MSIAYLLVSHGSRDPRSEIEMQHLALSIETRVKSKFYHSDIYPVRESICVASKTMFDICIGTAVLELSSQSLERQIMLFASQVNDKGYNHIKILPLFLLPGVHVMEDIPREVTQAQLALGKGIKLELEPYLGIMPNINWFVAQYMACYTQFDKWILLAHGSRRMDALRRVEIIAKDLGAVGAYWCMAPSWEDRLQEVVDSGYRNISILPYFLFPGGITDAIAKSIENAKLRFSSVNLHLAQPLVASLDLADLIGNIIADGTYRKREEYIFG
ncbi:MAG TPA: sirohydrochlorin chelatase [Richelia sp.]|nr:sirohydrochlorin chelatase [Richelia intracellularis]HAE05895.1 sirohydrochlorin chelatase [Richelia sp.]